MISYETRTGTINLSESFLAKLIGNEVTSCYGVVGMAPSGNRQRLFGMLSKDQAIDTGIKVTGDLEKMTVEIHIVVLYGMNINAIAVSITEKVKYIVAQATGLKVNKVIVKVDGIRE